MPSAEVRMRLLSNPTPTRYALADLSGASIGLTFEEIESVSRREPVFSRLAIVAP